MRDFKQLRNPEIPLPKKIPNTLEKQEKNIVAILDDLANGTAPFAFPEDPTHKPPSYSMDMPQ
jgi:hypothetical protein